MKRLNRADNGQIEDIMCEEIRDSYVELLSPFLEKYKDIDIADLMYVCNTTFNFELIKSKMREYSGHKD